MLASSHSEEPSGLESLRISLVAPPSGHALERALAEAEAALLGAGFGWQDVLRITAFGGRAALDPPPDLGGALAGRGALRSPSWTWVAQAPVDGGPIALEVLAARGPGWRVRQESPQVSVLEGPALRRAFLAGLEPADSERSLPLDAQCSLLLGRSEAALGRVGFAFEQTLRTWFYVPGICGLDPAGEQAYQRVNQARAAFYDAPLPRRFLGELRPPGAGEASSLNPASTGIGTAGAALVLGLEALAAPAGAVWVAALENPGQQPAYEYPRSVLVGAEASARPRFARALVELGPGWARLHVSGTAAIRGAQSLAPDDPLAQTRLTLENIERLIAAETIAAAFPGRTDTPGWRLRDLRQLRVYLKPGLSAAARGALRDLVAAQCPGVPALYVEADVCRSELLVEIEAHGGAL